MILRHTALFKCFEFKGKELHLSIRKGLLSFLMHPVPYLPWVWKAFKQGALHPHSGGCKDLTGREGTNKSLFLEEGDLREEEEGQTS